MPQTVSSIGMPLPQRHVFVYGTLRRGDDNDITQLKPSPRFVGAGVIHGVMYHLGAYPGVILAKSTMNGSDVVDHSTVAGDVVGEVYAIEPELERLLDEIEELYPQQKDEYFKRTIQVAVGLQCVNCIVYEINPAYVAGKRIIAGGDWVKYR